MRRRIVTGVVVAFLATACGAARPMVADPPKFDPVGQTKCDVAKSQSRPLVVEWPASDRAALESAARKHTVVVRYGGCQMEVLDRCQAPGRYGYSGLTRKDDGITIHDADELYAAVPLGAARLESKVGSGRVLQVNMTIVGRFEVDTPHAEREELVGDCAGATHIVTALTTGAFEFYFATEATVGAGATVLGAGAKAASSAGKQGLTRDGDIEACKSSRDDKAPPEGCAALLRVEVVPLGRAKPVEVSCPAGTVKEGNHCVRESVVTEVKCPRGTTWDGENCVGREASTPSGPSIRVIQPAENDGVSRSSSGDAARAVRTAGFVSAGVFTAAGAVFGAVALQTAKNVKDQCSGAVCSTALQADAERSALFGNLSTAGFVVGGAGLVVGIIGAALIPPRGPKSGAPFALLGTEIVHVGVRGGGIDLTGRF